MRFELQNTHRINLRGSVATVSMKPILGTGTGGGGTGDASGPASSTNDNLAAFDGTTGKLLKDSGLATAAVATLASPAFTGNPTAPTQTAGNNTTRLATTAFVTTAVAAVGGASAASETVAGIAELATQAETNTGTDDARIVTPLKFQTRLAAYAQPLDSDLTAIAALTTTSYGRAVLELANQAALMGLLSAASETASGIAEIATQAETNTGTDDVRFVTPLKLQTRLAAFAQPLDSDLTAIAALSTTSYGRALLTLADQAALLTAIGSSSTTASGVVELATSAETITGTDTARAVTPAGAAAAYQPLDSDLTAFAAKTAPSGAVVGTTDSQTLTNKTLTAPAISSPTGLVKGDVGLGNVANVNQQDAANLTSGTVAPARLGSGSGGSSKFLREDSTWQTISAGGGQVNSVVAGTNIDVDATDPANPIVSVETLTLADVSDVTASAAEVNVLDGVTASTAELNILDGVTATAAELNALDGITATVTELNYTDGVTSAIQTQIDGKQASDGDLTAIAGLSPTNDDVIQRKAGAWTNRTMAQVKTDLALTKGDVGLGNVANVDQTNADNLTSGTVADARIASTIARDSEVATVQTNLDNHVNDTTDAHDASAISFDNSSSDNIASSDVQGALADLDGTFNGVLAATMTKTYGGQETVAAASATTGSVTLNCANGNIFTVTPTGNITTLTISNPPTTGVGCTISLIVSQGATPRTIATPTGGVFIGAASPTQVANKICVFTYLTVDGGTTWICSAAVQV